jgi:hypothetical protein
VGRKETKKFLEAVSAATIEEKLLILYKGKLETKLEEKFDKSLNLQNKNRHESYSRDYVIEEEVRRGDQRRYREGTLVKDNRRREQQFDTIIFLIHDREEGVIIIIIGVQIILEMFNVIIARVLVM